MFASDLASFGHICAIHQEWAWNFPDFQFSKPFQPSLRIHQAQHRHRRLQRGGRRGAGSTGLAAGSAGAAGRGTARIGGVVGDAGNSHESSRCLGMRRLADTQWFHVLNLNLADFFWLSEKYITQLPVYALPVPWSCMYPFKRYVIHIHIYIHMISYVSAQLTDGYCSWQPPVQGMGGTWSHLLWTMEDMLQRSLAPGIRHSNEAVKSCGADSWHISLCVLEWTTMRMVEVTEFTSSLLVNQLKQRLGLDFGEIVQEI